MSAKAMQFTLAKCEIEQRLRRRMATINDRIMISSDPTDAYELTLRVSELQRALYLFQDFHPEVNAEAQIQKT